MSNKKFYAYLLVETTESGVVNTWEDLQSKVKGKKARFKSFKSIENCVEWLDTGAIYEKKSQIIKEMKENLPKGIYFDAGTGRGIGVEVRVTDNKGVSLLHHNSYETNINEFGNVLLAEGKTNNFGELLGLIFALDIADKLNVNAIYGDSKLVIEYWSKGRYNASKLDKDTIELINFCYNKRSKFKGTIGYVSGDYNPADLGFHK